MNIDVAGRVRNVQLPSSKPLLPLFEAISNSLDAIEDASEPNGSIEIEIIRDENTLFSGSTSISDRQLADIIGFIVRDNGIGFDKRNYEEFNKSDTTYKVSRGGKGIGRFMWLAAFNSAEIESIFYENNSIMKRYFVFRAEEPGIFDHLCTEVPDGIRGTTVKLIGYKERYRKQCPRRLETIAAYIVEEFLDIFLGPSCPKIVISDKITRQIIDLEEFYEAEMVAHSERKKLRIKDQPFDVLHVRLYSTHIPEHRLYFCARDRVVTREKLSGIPNLSSRLLDSEGKEFVYAAYINSYILDNTVNADRTGFNIPEDDEGLFVDGITMSDIRKEVRNHCKEYLSPYTEPIKAAKCDRIHRFVQEEGPMYRPILKYLEPKFDNIEPDATDEQIDQHLYEAYHELQVTLKKEGQALFQAVSSEDVEFETFQKQFDEYFTKVSEINRANLARYVCHRKSILKFFRQQISRQNDSKYKLENRIHTIIFPPRKTSDDIFFEEHNLWLVDERLAFHVFLSSDKPLRQASPLQNDSKREPDIIVFDKALALSETTNIPFTSITIIEFKRPQRNDYSETENPFSQIADYIREIKGGKAKLADGCSMTIPLELPFYCFVICDITPRLINWAENFELERTPDGIGFFGYKRHLHAYFEVISYQKLLSDAEKRNQAFFEKLGLPK